MENDIQGSNKGEWQQQILNFLDPVTENATIDNMVYELLLKSGKDLNSTIEHKKDYYGHKWQRLDSDVGSSYPRGDRFHPC